RFGARITDAVAGTAGPDGVVRPVVLVGADTGAVAVAALLGSGERPDTDAAVLAGLPARTAAPGDWDDEL
ncbi:alpha/beta hydrolase, partial [Streptomyces sp. SID8455]|nr:alpha/beta hydrolase [Streptomyces sp. SID8455]